MLAINDHKPKSGLKNVTLFKASDNKDFEGAPNDYGWGIDPLDVKPVNTSHIGMVTKDVPINAIAKKLIEQEAILKLTPLRITLKELYTTDEKNINAFGDTLSIEKHYEDVILQVKIPGKGKETEKGDNKKLEYKEITVEEFFSPKSSSGKIPRTILMEGDAGTGKTTFCQKTLYDWGSNQLWSKKFLLIFRINLGDLTNKKFKSSMTSLEEILENSLKNTKACKKIRGIQSFTSLLEAIPEKILFLLDSKDEYSMHPEGNNSNTSYEIEELIKIFNIISTSRPNKTGDTEFDLLIENSGFAPEQITNYVNNYPDIDSKKVNAYISKTDGFSELARSPLNLFLICNSWKEMASNESPTRTTLYETLIKHKYKLLLRRKETQIGLTNKQDGNEEILRHFNSPELVVSMKRIEKILKDEINALEALGFYALMNNTKTLSRNEVEEVIKNITAEHNVLHESGFISAVNKSKLIEEDKFEFHHITFRDYLAAKHLARHLHNENKKISAEENTQEFIKQNKYNPNYKNMFIFLAGSLRDKHESLILFFEILLSPPNTANRYYNEDILLGCINECASEGNASVLNKIQSNGSSPYNIITDYILNMSFIVNIARIYYSDFNRQMYKNKNALLFCYQVDKEFEIIIKYPNLMSSTLFKSCISTIAKCGDKDLTRNLIDLLDHSLCGEDFFTTIITHYMHHTNNYILLVQYANILLEDNLISALENKYINPTLLDKGTSAETRIITLCLLSHCRALNSQELNSLLILYVKFIKKSILTDTPELDDFIHSQVLNFKPPSKNIIIEPAKEIIDFVYENKALGPRADKIIDVLSTLLQGHSDEQDITIDFARLLIDFTLKFPKHKNISETLECFAKNKIKHLKDELLSMIIFFDGGLKLRT